MAKIYGVKASRQGFDVDTASDKQLAFSSQWPLLPIEAEGTKSVTASTAYDQTLYTHGLGYVPAFMVWFEISGKRYPISNGTFLNIWVDDTELHIDDTPASSGTIHWKLFRRDLLKNYDSGTLVSTDATEKDSSDYGLIVSLPGKSADSTDKRDFSIRSDVRQLMIHKTGYYDDSTNGRVVTHSLGYQPMYWLYLANTDKNPANSYSLAYQADDFRVFATTSTLTYVYYGFPFFKSAYIIFKDPVNAIG
jgi:hypothetical protein